MVMLVFPRIELQQLFGVFKNEEVDSHCFDVSASIGNCENEL